MYYMSAACERTWRPTDYLWLMFDPDAFRSVLVTQVLQS